MKRSVFLLVFLAMACSDDMLVAPVDSEFQIAVGEVAEIKGTSLALRFVRVTLDNRCPGGAACVQTVGAGNAQIELQSSLDGEESTFVLNTSAGVTETQVGAYRVKLAGLTPVPQIGQDIRNDQYRASLLVYD
jgi:hypothetical protein